MNLQETMAQLDTSIKDNDKLRLVGTDGYRLSYSEIAVQFPDLFLQNGVCLSKRALLKFKECVTKV